MGRKGKQKVPESLKGAQDCSREACKLIRTCWKDGRTRVPLDDSSGMGANI